MKTITTHEAKTHLSRYLAEIENGEQFIIARGKKPIARLMPMEKTVRPRVGQMMDAPLHLPDSVFAPLSTKELIGWGL